MTQQPALSSRFEVLRTLGAGGMGLVYEALDRDRDVRVALKTLRQFTPEGLARFKREFRAMEALHHPNLVSLGELVCEGGQWFFTMELLRGVDFIHWVRPHHRMLTGVSASWPHGPTSGMVICARDALTMDAPADALAEIASAVPASDLASTSCHEPRLRDALAQLARGLVALHDAKCVHRDVKPSNVHVTEEGRVVLLDFGIVSELELAREPLSASDGLVGTPGYMAPEQAASGAVTPAADWYGVGAMLYEALTGRLPFEGSNAEILAQKQAGAPPSPGALVRDVPVDLEALCIDLLQRDPERRPPGREVLERLVQRSERASGAPAPMPSRDRTSRLVGRDDEMRALDAAHDAAARSAIAIVVYGESGIGKTWLVRAFVERITASDEDAFVLHGKCREREAVPYKALDDAIDQLAARLDRMPAAAVSELVPAYIGALLHVFPVLRQVEAFRRHAEIETEARTLDPRELRRRAFLALRDLFGRLAELGRVIVVIDDLQWADQDSLALIGTLLRPPDPPPVLFLASVRTSPLAPSEVPRDVVASVPGDVRLLHVGPLSERSARELAAKQIAIAGAEGAALAETIAADAKGHPLFIDELARRAAGGHAIAALKLDDALWSRIEELAPVERTVAQLVAISPRPLSQEIVARAAEIHVREFVETAARLRASNLVRTGGARPTDRIEPYHDRVREVVVGRLADGSKRALHERLARALEPGQASDAEALALHWREAGFEANARKYAEIAAEHAWNALAFDRAAEWYAAAIDLASPEQRMEDRALRARLGEALGNAGRGALAAAALQSAAAGADTAEALELQRRAVDQLLRCGHVDEGLDVAARVLALVGMKLPRSPLHALFLLFFWRLAFLLRGARYVRRDPSRIAPRTLMRIDACSSLGSTLGLSDMVTGWLFSTRALLFALDAGDPGRIVYPMAAEAARSASGGKKTWRRTRARLDEATKLARESGDDKAIAWVLANNGYMHYAAGEYRVALGIIRRAEDALLTCGAKGYELSSTQFFLTNTLAILGRLKECSARVPALLQEACERDDLFAAVNHRTGHSNLAWLIVDEPDVARRHLADAMRSWSKRGFHVEHYFELIAGTSIALYVGDAEEANGLLTRSLPLYERSFLSRVQNVRLRIWLARARCALASVAAGAGDRDATLRLVRRMSRKIVAEESPWGPPSAALLGASVAKAEGDRALAVRLLRAAKAGFDAEGLELDAAVASHCLGTLLTGDEGTALIERARRWMRAQTVKRPDRFVAMIAPGLVSSP
jgi:serine/threonine protein kinase